MKHRRAQAVAALAGVVALTGCGASASNNSTASAGISPTCTADRLVTVREDKLTIATDNPALEPWFSGNEPSNGEGFESAVGYRIATALGYHPHNVVWRRVPFRDIIAPGQKPFDLALDEVTIKPERAKHVDFSTPYFTVTQAVLMRADGKFADVTTVAGLANARLGALGGTTSYAAITSTIKPKTAPKTYNSMAQAITDLNDDAIDGIVTDLPTAFELARERVRHGKVIGQLEASGQPEQFGVVLPKASKLTGCVDQALARIKKNGTLEQLDDEWTVLRGAPKLK